MDDGHPGENGESSNAAPKKNLFLPNLPSTPIASPESMQGGITDFDPLNPGYQSNQPSPWPVAVPSPEIDPESENQDNGHSPRKRWWLGGIFILLVAGTAITLPKAMEMVDGWRQEAQFRAYEQEQHQDSEVLKLALLPPAQRDAKLQAIADQGEASLERSRARFLLAGDLLDKFEGGPAIRMLEGLEVDYPVLAPYILLMRGRGYRLSNENDQAKAVWQTILEKYPDSPVVVNALENLGTLDKTYWQKAIADHASHPRTLAILHQQLESNPGSLEIQQQILQNHPTDGRTAAVITYLVKNNQGKLTPEDWQAIGDNYWHRRIYNQAIAPYQKAPSNARNLYRLARAQQISKLDAEAKENYRKLISTYPNTPETALALRRLAELLPPAEGVKYLQQWEQKFPDQGAFALAAQIDLLSKFDAKGAQQAQQTLLKKYSDSDAAANYRWRQAQEFAKGGNYAEAWRWSKEIANQNPQSDVAPKAIFWIGKWAQQLGRSADSKAAWETVLAKYPQSYYAWRSAVLLGWQVGDFNTVRFLNPPVTVPDQRPLPPAGSATFRELFRLAQDQEAIELFEAEIPAQLEDQTVPELTVNEGFTQALLKLSQQEYLQGINQVLNLRNPEDPKQRQEWEKLRGTKEYWEALFPFPYQQLIFDWSAKRQLNPFLVTALIRQESRFEKEIKSPVGATGLMQVMPSTGEWIAPQIGLKEYSLTDPSDNVNMGTWYFDHTHKTYNNNSALAVASYNAGPGNVAKWLTEFNNADPDLFVEKIPFAETKGYVESVFGNYWNYLRIYDPDVIKLMGRVDKP
jgi:soluble lytic murein transglycosylase